MAGTGVPRAGALCSLVLLLALCVPAAHSQFSQDRLPIEEVSMADIFRACEVPIESEIEDGVVAPMTLSNIGVAGTWAYERTNKGVLKNPSLPSDTGRIDMWISNDTAGSNLGLLHDISAVLYVTGTPPLHPLQARPLSMSSPSAFGTALCTVLSSVHWTVLRGNRLRVSRKQP